MLKANEPKKSELHIITFKSNYKIKSKQDLYPEIFCDWKYTWVIRTLNIYKPRTINREHIGSMENKEK